MLDLAFWNIVSFTVVLIIIFFAFSVFCMLIFGYHMREFHNLGDTTMTLLKMAIGELSEADYDEMKKASVRHCLLPYDKISDVVYSVYSLCLPLSTQTWTQMAIHALN